MIVQACLNGARSRDYHPRLPVTIDTIAEEAVDAVAAGAAELHLHVRGPDGAESLAPAAVDATIGALRARLPGTLVGVSTGAWIEKDEDCRLTMIAGWSVLPDHVSVNVSEGGAPALIERLHRRGVGVEAGLASAADAERLVRLRVAPPTPRVLGGIEGQAPGWGMVEGDPLPAVLARARPMKPRLLPRGGAP